MDERTSHRVLFCAERFHKLIVFLQSGPLCLSYMEKKSYIEIKVPFTYQTDCFDRLRHRLEGLPIHWQLGYYHITMAFIDETHCVDDIKYITCK